MSKGVGFFAPVLLSSFVVASCGGSGGGSDPVSPPPAAPPGQVSNAQRAAAATVTANSNALCAAVAPFYWEIGNKDGKLVSGSLGTSYAEDTLMSIASASKWLYSAYVVEKKNGALDAATDVPFLNFTSGYSNFSTASCDAKGTVQDCLQGQNGTLNPNEAAKAIFHYNGGHMQKHASNIGLGLLVDSTLAMEVRLSGVGADVQMAYTQPQPAGGVFMNAQNYASFLRKLLVGSAIPLKIGSLLGSSKVCTLPSSGCNSAFSPVPEAWHYSLGHWVEDDPNSMPAGDGSFSSPGAFGFYPWVDSTRALYGIIARQAADHPGEGFDSALCGRLVRRAWMTGTAQ